MQLLSVMHELSTLRTVVQQLAIIVNDPKNRGRNGALKANPLARVRQLIALHPVTEWSSVVAPTQETLEAWREKPL